MNLEEFEGKYGKGVDVEVGARFGGVPPIEVCETEKSSQAHVYKIDNRFFEICQPLNPRPGDNPNSVFFGGEINNNGEEARDSYGSVFCDKKSSTVVLREVKPCMTDNGKVTMARSPYPTILTKKGLYTCKEHEHVENVVEDQFLIVTDVIERVGQVKNITNGDSLFHSFPRANDMIYYNGEKKEFSMDTGIDYGYKTISLESVLTEVQEREKANRSLAEFGITFNEARSVSDIVRSHEQRHTKTK